MEEGDNVWQGDGSNCPKDTFQCGNRTLDEQREYVIRYVIPIVVSVLSCLGSVAIMVAYLALRDIRTGAQTIVTLLAIADFIYSLSFLMAPINRFTYYDDTDQGKCSTYQVLCTIQAYLTVWSGWCVFLWNSALAFYFFLRYVLSTSAVSSKLIPIYNILCWGVPTIVAVSLLGAGKLGLYPLSPLCFVKPQDSSAEYNTVHLFAGELAELVSFVFVGVLYTAISVHICKQSSGKFTSLLVTQHKAQKASGILILYIMLMFLSLMQRYQSHVLSSAVPGIEKQLVLIPFLYIALRVWDSVKYFMIVGGFPTNPCEESTTQTVGFIVIAILESIGDGGQGLVNAILFVFLSREIRKRLFWNPLKQIFERLKQCCGRSNPWKSYQITVDSPPLIPPPSDEQQSTLDHGYDTYFSLPSDPDFPRSSNQGRTDYQQPNVYPPIQASQCPPVVLSTQSSRRSDTYFTPSVTGIASSI